MIALAALLAACGDRPLLQDAKGKWRVLAQVPVSSDDAHLRAAAAAALRGHAPAAVVALDAAAVGAVRAVDPATQVVAVAAAPPEAIRTNEAFVIEPTGAATAIVLALLACNGVALPPTVGLGARVVTAANAAAGGEARPAPGDFAMLMLGREHPDAVTTKPATDVSFAIAFVQIRADTWCERVRSEVQAEAGRYPQLVLETHAAGGDAAAWRGLVEQCVRKNVRAVLLASDDWQSLQPVAALAEERKVALIGLDRSLRASNVTASVGCDPRLLGGAVGDTVAKSMPSGGALVELHGDFADEGMRRRHEGFAEKLGLHAH